MTLNIEEFRPADPEQVWGLHFESPDQIRLSDLSVEERQKFEQVVAPLVMDTRAKVSFRGGWTCACVAQSLPYVEEDMKRRGLIKKNIDLYQLGYNAGGVAASAGTHDRGMMIDVGQYSDAQLRCWWDWGWAMQRRTRAQGFSGDHGHGGPYGCTHGASLAEWQMDQYVRYGRDGLRSNGIAAGPKQNLIRYDKAINNYENKLTAAKVAEEKRKAQEDFPMDQTTFNRMMNSWATSPEGKRNLSIAAVSATYGDIDGDGKADTIGGLMARTAYEMKKLRDDVTAIKKRGESQ